MLYTLNLYRPVCQLYPSKTGGKKEIECLNKSGYNK